MEKKRIGITVIVVAAFVLFIFLVGKSKTNGNAECSNDDDCIKQRTACCSCKMGGEEVCMGKKNVSLWQEKIRNECQEDMICTAQYNCRDARCLCKEEKCIEE